MKPLVIDLYCGLGGWSRAFLDAGYDAIGFDIERHQYGEKKYPGQLVLQDVLTLHGSQLKDAACIVASSPCQKYSYMAMPWSRAKEQAKWYREDPVRQVELNALFNASFRIQREASEAAGRHIPLVAENVKGAQPWIGMAKAHFGSFYLWGDVESVGGRITVGKFGHSLRPFKAQKFNPDGTGHGQGSWFKIADSKNRGTGRKVPGMNFHEFENTGKPGRSFQSAAVDQIKVGGDWFGPYAAMKAAGTISPTRTTGKHTQARKQASAEIAEIPYDLALWIAECFKPTERQPGLKARAGR